MPDPRSLLPIEELRKPRTPPQLAAWVDGKIAAIAEVEEARGPALKRQRPFKQFYEEIYPLNLFVKHRYSDRESIVVTYNPDTGPFDAVVRDGSVSPPRDVMVEITLARDPQWYLRMEFFVKHGHVDLWSPVITSGNKRDRKTHVPMLAVDREEHVRRDCGWIKKAANRKASKTARYGPSHVLIIAFDDWWSPSDEDIAALRAFVTDHVLPVLPKFAALYVLGLSGRTYLPFLSMGSGGENG